MKTLRIYVDTSVIGGCCDPEFATWSNGLMDDFKSGRYKPVLSDVVEAELREGAPAEVMAKFDALLACNPERIAVTDAVVALAEMYLADGILTETYLDDALHIALATVGDADVLVSWNFKHIVNLRKIQQFTAVNLREGYKALEIRAPREVTTHGLQDA